MHARDDIAYLNFSVRPSEVLNSYVPFVKGASYAQCAWQRLGLFSKMGKRSEDLLRDIPSASTVECETPTVTLADGSLL